MNTRRWIVLVAVLVVVAAVTTVLVSRHSQPSQASLVPAASPSAGTPAASSPAALGGSPAPVAPSGKGPADAAIVKLNKTFLVSSSGKAYYRMSTEGGRVTFFKQAELIEMTQDAWQRSRDPAYKALMGQLYKGLLAHSSTLSSWMIKTNDDLMWATIMCLRAYRITGNSMYLTQAKKVFDATYARSYSTALGGGLWNSSRNLTKNACIVLPASIAASMLYQSLHNTAYLRKSKQLYAWLKRTLYDPSTGAVWDHATPAPGGGMTVDKTTWTYNQGALIGAADLLYRITKNQMYRNDAMRTLAFAKSKLTVNGILKSEVPAGSTLAVSSGGYKGIFVRWAGMFIKRYRLTSYATWLQQNAAAVRPHANSAGLMNEDWTAQTGSGPLSAFSCSSAVVLLQWTAAIGG